MPVNLGYAVLTCYKAVYPGRAFSVSVSDGCCHSEGPLIIQHGRGSFSVGAGATAQGPHVDRRSRLTAYGSSSHLLNGTPEDHRSIWRDSVCRGTRQTFSTAMSTRGLKYTAKKLMTTA